MARNIIQCECGGELEAIARTQFRTGLQYGDTTDATVFLDCSKCPQIFMVDIHEDEKIDAAKISAYDGKLAKEQIVEWAPHVRGNYFTRRCDKEVLEKIKAKSKRILHDYFYCVATDANPGNPLVLEFKAASDEEAHKRVKEDKGGMVMWVARKI